MEAPMKTSETGIARRIPLLHDAHTHPLLYAALIDSVDLDRVPGGAEEALTALRDSAGNRSTGWTIGHGWDPIRQPLTQSDLDAIDQPVVALHRSLHGLIVNRSGLPMLQALDPEAAASIRNDHWVEANLRRVLNLFIAPNSSVERLVGFHQWLAATGGVWSVDEMLLVSPGELALYEAAGLRDRCRFWAAPSMYAELSTEQRSQVHGLKVFADGAIGQHTAALHRPYRDRNPEERGLLLLTAEAVASEIDRAVAFDKPLAIHAIGDRAIDAVIAGAERVREHGRPPRVRIEHAQLISEPAAHRAKALGLHLCLQPNFSADSSTYRDRLPAGLDAANNPFRMLMDRAGFCPGVDLFLGSDGMPHGVEAALQAALFPPLASQRLTLDEFVAGYCLPDLTHGWIDVEIDWTASRCTCRPNLARR